MKSLLSMVLESGIMNTIVSIMTLKSYLQYFKKMPKSGTEFTL